LGKRGSSPTVREGANSPESTPSLTGATARIIPLNSRYETSYETTFLPSRKGIRADRGRGVPFAGSLVALPGEISGSFASFRVAWCSAGSTRWGFPAGPDLSKQGLDEVGGSACLRNDEGYPGYRFLFHRDADRCD